MHFYQAQVAFGLPFLGNGDDVPYFGFVELIGHLGVSREELTILVQGRVCVVDLLKIVFVFVVLHLSEMVK